MMVSAGINRHERDAEFGYERVEFGNAGGSQSRHDHDSCLDRRSGRDQPPRRVRRPRQQKIRGRFSAQDRDERRAVDDDHCGRPSPS